MEFITVVLFLIVFVLINAVKNTLLKRFDALEAEIQRLYKEMSARPVEHVVQSVEHASKTVRTPVPPPQAGPEPVKPEPVKPAVPPPVIPEAEKPLTEELGSLLERFAVPNRTSSPKPEHLQPQAPPVAAFTPAPVAVPPAPPPAPSQPSFMERNPDLEKFIGENLVSKIGIAILVLAIGFFVKYAIDNNWIGPVGRVGIGVLCGGILVAVAHRLRNSYKGFSSVLVGGGLAVFYFTITLAYQQFNLFSQTVAFIIMVVITAFAVVLSQLYDRQELAVIALVGGFATPFMVSSGSGNYKVLFSYLLILNGGLLAIAYNKAWRILNALAFIFTVVLFGGWLFNLPYATSTDVYRGGFLFATLLYLLFLAVNIAHNIKERRQFLASDFGILLSNTALYFAAGLYCLSAMKQSQYHGLFSACMGVFNLALSYILLRRQRIDKNILYLLIGITLTFISLTAPIQLEGNFITLFWASECVLLYWLYLRSQIPIIRIASMIIWGAMLVSLMLVWFNTYAFSFSHVAVIANKGFITTVFAALASYGLFLLRRNEIRQAFQPASWPNKQVFRVAALVLLFLAGIFEINYQFNFYYHQIEVSMLYLLLYITAFILVLTTVSQRVASLALPNFLHYGLLVVCLLIYLLSLVTVFDIQQAMLTEHLYQGHFAAHWATAVLVAIVLFVIIRSLQATAHPLLQENKPVITWMVCTVIVIYASAEVHLLANTLFYSADNPLDRIQRVYVKAGLPILWGALSFLFMYTGMRSKFRTLRIVSLTLFLLTLLKLFIYDIRNIPVAGKIAAFFILGVLLLIVSFMYQRLKNIIIEDGKNVSV